MKTYHKRTFTLTDEMVEEASSHIRATDDFLVDRIEGYDFKVTSDQLLHEACPLFSMEDKGSVGDATVYKCSTCGRREDEYNNNHYYPDVRLGALPCKVLSDRNDPRDLYLDERIGARLEQEAADFKFITDVILED